MYFYQNGAYRDVNPLGVLGEPPVPSHPEEEHRLRSNQLTFARLKLKAAQDQFNELDERLSFANPSDPDAAIAELKKLKAVVTERQKLVAAAEEALSQTAWGKQRAAMAQQEKEQKQRMAAFQHRRKSVKI
jgi:hypothetical protein